MNFSLSRKKNENVAIDGSGEFVDSIDNRLDLIGVVSNRSISDVHRVGAALNGEHRRGRTISLRKVLCEPFGINCCRGNDEV